MVMILELNKEDIDRIIEVERRVFIPPLQATKKTILHRFNLNHMIYGAEVNGEIVGTVAFRYGIFSPSLHSFPKSFQDYANQPSERGNATFGYSFGFIPEYRSSVLPYKLAMSLIERSKRDGIEHILAIGRCPSYNGSRQYAQEVVAQNLEVQNEIDRCIAQNKLPSKEILKRDPVMRFYIQLFNPEILGILQGFFPGDTPSGEFLILQYKNVEK